MPDKKIENNKDFEDKYEQYWRQLYIWAFQWLNNSDDAEDAAADVWVKKWHNRAQYDPEKATYKTYLKRNMLNHCKDIWKRKKLDIAELPDDIEMEGFEDSLIDRAALEKVMENLTPHVRFLMYCKYVEGWSWLEIANICGMPPGTIRSRIERQLLQLRQELAEHQ